MSAIVSVDNTREEPGHNVAACARTTGHGCVRINPTRPGSAQPSDEYNKSAKALVSEALLSARVYAQVVR